MWLEAQVEGSGVLTFDWKVSSEHRGDLLLFYVDGQKVISPISGDVDWTTVSVDIPGNTTHTLRWVYTKNGSVTSGADMGYLRKVVWSQNEVDDEPLTYEKALDGEGLEWTSAGESAWVACDVGSHDGVDCAKSGTIAHENVDGYSESTIETTVSGNGELSFYWKLDTEGYTAAGADIYVDGEILYDHSLYDAIDWTKVALKLPKGEHIIEWVFLSDGTIPDATLWLDEVEFVKYKTSAGVTYDWLDQYPTILNAADGNYEQAANAQAANGVNTVGECYIAGLDPTNEVSAFTSSIEIIDDAVVVSWTPNVNEEEPKSRVYTVQQLIEDEWKDVSVTREANEMKITKPDADPTGVWLYRVKVALPK